MPTAEKNPTRLRRKPWVSEVTGYSETYIDEKDKLDPTFPRRVQIGPRAGAWVEDEVLAWVENIIRQRDAAA